MTGNDYLQNLVALQKRGIPEGIYSICSADSYVITAAMKKALTDDTFVLIEATSNQVNQFGGYMGMKPEDFREFVHMIARRIGLPLQRIILGGDHLGPNPWKDEEAEVALKKACEMIKAYVTAGFSKIHLDASMYLGGDQGDRSRLPDHQLIAERTSLLALAAEEAFAKVKKSSPNATPPVYVIGTEVPVPGGNTRAEQELKVTEVSDFANTVKVSREAFHRHGLHDAWQRVMAVVVQPGVEFGHSNVRDYDREKARKLCDSLKYFPNLVFEGHSTDYQRRENLKHMVEDGVAIVKVGPALTFAKREALFSLSCIENELLRDEASVQLSNLVEVLDKVMIQSPEHWTKYYDGDDREIELARKFSFSDRSRYYWSVPEVREAVDRLLQNLKSIEIPLTLLSQFMPVQYGKIRKRLLKNDVESLVLDRIADVLDDYSYAVGI